MRDLTGTVWEDVVRASTEPIMKGVDEAKLLVGTVTAVEGVGWLTVLLAGEQDTVEGIRHLDSYNPAVDDVVYILQSGPDFIAIGRLKNLRTEVAGLLAPPVVVGQPGSSIAFQNGWDRMASTLFSPPAVWMDHDGVVHMAGAMQGGTASQAAFTLPPELRPERTLKFLCCHEGTSAGVGNSMEPFFVEVQITTDGKVSPWNGAWFTDPGHSTAFGLSLNNIHFLPKETGKINPLRIRQGSVDDDAAEEIGNTPFFTAPGASGVFVRDDGWCLAQGMLEDMQPNQLVGRVPSKAAHPYVEVMSTWAFDSISVVRQQRLDIFGQGIYNRGTGAAQYVSLNGMHWWNFKRADTWLDMEDEGWLNSNNWRPYTEGTIYERPGLRIDRDGVVHLRGLIYCHSTAAVAGPPVLNALVIAYLPSRYMPPWSGVSDYSQANYSDFLVEASHGGGSKIRLDRINQSGLVYNRLLPWTAGVGYWLSLNGMTWRTDANAVVKGIV